MHPVICRCIYSSQVLYQSNYNFTAANNKSDSFINEKSRLLSLSGANRLLSIILCTSHRLNLTGGQLLPWHLTLTCLRFSSFWMASWPPGVVARAVSVSAFWSTPTVWIFADSYISHRERFSWKWRVHHKLSLCNTCYIVQIYQIYSRLDAYGTMHIKLIKWIFFFVLYTLVYIYLGWLIWMAQRPYYTVP